MVYRDGVMCSDSQVQTGTLRTGTMKKVLKTKDGWLVGAAGDCNEIQRFFKWMEGDRNPDEALKFENMSGIVVSPKGEVFWADSNLDLYSTDVEFAAVGSGEKLAIGAMAMGASAEEAVRVCIKYDTGCGGKIQKVKL